MLWQRAFYNRLDSNALYSGSEFRPKQAGNDDFYQVTRQIWYDSGCQSLRQGEIHLDPKPDGTEQITDCSTEDQAEYGKDPFSRKVFDKKSGDDHKKNITEHISTGRSGDFCKPSAKTGEDRQSDGTEQQIDQAADGTQLHAKDIG